jgi:DNA-binding protein HU-beta
MHKTDLIKAAAEKAGLTQKDTSTALEAVLGVITETLSKGESVTLTGFGTFEVRQRSERAGTHPQTREKITIPASKTAGWTPGAEVKKAIRGA